MPAVISTALLSNYATVNAFTTTERARVILWAMVHADTLAHEKKRKDYAFWRQFIEKPSIIPGCPELAHDVFPCQLAHVYTS